MMLYLCGALCKIDMHIHICSYPLNKYKIVIVKSHIFKGQIGNFNKDLSGKFLEKLGSKCKKILRTYVQRNSEKWGSNSNFRKFRANLKN